MPVERFWESMTNTRRSGSSSAARRMTCAAEDICSEIQKQITACPGALAALSAAMAVPGVMAEVLGVVLCDSDQA